MSDSKISDLPVASSISGTELVPVVQSGVTKQVQASLLGGGGGGTTTNALSVDNVSLQLNSGTTFNGSAAKTISVKNSGIDLTTKVTGLLPDANIASAAAWNANILTQQQQYIIKRTLLNSI